MKEFFSILSGIVTIIGFIWYGYSMREKKAEKDENKKKNETVPNLPVISFWLLLAIISTLTYILIVKDYYKAIFQLVGLVANLILILMLIHSKKYASKKKDWIIVISLTVALITLAVLILSGVIFDVKDLHVLIQIFNTLSYIPLIWTIAIGKGKEPIGPWLVITLAVVIALIAILMDKYKDFWELFYAVLHPARSIVLQLIVIAVSYFKLKRAPWVGLLPYIKYIDWCMKQNNYILNMFFSRRFC